MTTDSAEIPIWVNGKQLWISGVDRKTTVNDVVKTLLGRPDKQYSITEKWRQVERSLNGETRILKLWQTWGDDTDEVKFSLKKNENENYDVKNIHIDGLAKNKQNKYKSTRNKYAQNMHSKRLPTLPPKSHNVQRLLKLILVQAETIQNQISRLNERDLQIEALEDQDHSLDSNYQLDTYSGSNVITGEKEDSGVVTECTPSSENNGSPATICEPRTKDNEINIELDDNEIDELHAKINLLEGIVKLNKKLEKQEENLIRLYINIERCKKDDNLIQELHNDLAKLKNENDEREIEMKKNAILLMKLEQSLDSRKYHLEQLDQNFCDETMTFLNTLV